MQHDLEPEMVSEQNPAATEAPVVDARPPLNLPRPKPLDELKRWNLTPVARWIPQVRYRGDD